MDTAVLRRQLRGTRAMSKKLTVIGGGLAGCEAAWQAANRGIEVTLYEMKPKKFSPAHSKTDFAELVCSNSLRADGLSNAVGLLKEEMRCLNSVIMKAADETKVPAGGALAVDRDGFAALVTKMIREHKNITVINDEVTEIPSEGMVIIATGPLTSEPMQESIAALIGKDYLHFYDAAAPIVTKESIDMSRAYFASRYGKGDGTDYINCPMNKDEYTAFYDALVNAETAELEEWDKKINVFEGCMPVEIMASRGFDTLRFGPMKPVGLPNPHEDGRIPYAVLQLRRDNFEGTLYNLVGFQTHLKFPEQRRVFKMIPGLENAEFMRYGVMHRNTFLNSPLVLDKYYRLKADERIFFAGQMTGVEGYVESASSGLVCGLCAANILNGEEPVDFTTKTAIGSLQNYVATGTNTSFQPMNINFGIIDSLDERVRDKKERYERISHLALEVLSKKV